MKEEPGTGRTLEEKLFTTTGRMGRPRTTRLLGAPAAEFFL
jgi:hypothetical protein